MVTAAAYILKVPPGRREILLREPTGGRFVREEPSVGEPVPRFYHSRRAPLIVLACFDDDAITHIAEGRKGLSAGTGLTRLNLDNLTPLSNPIPFVKLVDRSPTRVRSHVDRVLRAGGTLPPKSLGAVVDALIAFQPDLSARLARFSQRRSEFFSRTSATSLTNLGLQKETVATALELASLDRRQLLSWVPGTEAPRYFLEGLPSTYVLEDAVLISDLSSLPGFEPICNLPFAARVFESTSDPSVHLTVVMANRLPLEEQTGADLIYYNEAYKSFVLVQYKMMEKGEEEGEFRWRPGDQLASEIARMDELLSGLRQLPGDDSPMSFRLHSNPFFLKLCPRVLFNPDDQGLFKGMYIPLDLWKSLAAHPSTEGPRGGRVLKYSTVGRKLNNSEFVTLVANSWVGTTVPQSKFLEDVVRQVLATGRTVTLAVKAGRAVRDSGSNSPGEMAT
jgi:hypothetical protein